MADAPDARALRTAQTRQALAVKFASPEEKSAYDRRIAPLRRRDRLPLAEAELTALQTAHATLARMQATIVGMLARRDERAVGDADAIDAPNAVGQRLWPILLASLKPKSEPGGKPNPVDHRHHSTNAHPVMHRVAEAPRGSRRRGHDAEPDDVATRLARPPIRGPPLAPPVKQGAPPSGWIGWRQ